jgi:hypothetical protein
MSSDIQQILKSVEALSLEDRQEFLMALEQAALIPEFELKRLLILCTQGKYAHVRTSSEEFMARKREDLALEH